MKVAELTNKIPRIRVKDADTGRVYDGYYCEFPETTYCCLPHPPIKTVRAIVTYNMTDWGLPNEPRLYKLDDEVEVEFLKNASVMVDTENKLVICADECGNKTVMAVTRILKGEDVVWERNVEESGVIHDEIHTEAAPADR